jgi:hypothetical protein
MPSRSRPTQAKRAREKALIEKRQLKAARRVDVKGRDPLSPRLDGVDPDIADIVAGPQPHLFLDPDELKEAEEGEEGTEEAKADEVSEKPS